MSSYGAPLLSIAMLAAVQPLIGGEHDDRVGQTVGVLQRLDDAADGVVDREQGLAGAAALVVDVLHVRRRQEGQLLDVRGLVGDVGLVEVGSMRDDHRRELAQVARCRLLAAMRSERCEHQEQRLRRRCRPDEAGGVAREDVRGVVGGSTPVCLERAVVAELVVVVGASGVVVEPREGVPVAPARRRRRTNPAVPVLADEPRPVPDSGERGGDRRAVVEGSGAMAVGAVREHAAPVRLAAGEQRGPARAARGVDHDAVGEGRAMTGQQRLHVRHHAEVVPALVVGQDHDDVRPSAPGLADRVGAGGRRRDLGHRSRRGTARHHRRDHRRHDELTEPSAPAHPRRVEHACHAPPGRAHGLRTGLDLPGPTEPGRCHGSSLRLREVSRIPTGRERQPHTIIL